MKFKTFYNTVYFYLNAFIIMLSAYFKIIFKKYDWHKYVYDSKKIIDLIKRCGGKVYIDTKELENVKPPVVLVSNHMSSLEAFIFGYIIGKYFKFTFVLKESLIHYPIFGKIVKFLKPIAVSRENVKSDFKKVITETKSLFKENISVLVFPQATRSLTIDEEKFNSIGVKLSNIFKVPIVPICVKTDFLTIGKYIKDLGKVDITKDVYVKVFKPIPPQEVNKSTNQKIVSCIKNYLLSIS